MRSLMQLAGQASSRVLAEQDLDWLHLLLADWQVLADLAAADLVLWLPTDDGRFIAVAHCRPSTATTVHLDDIIGLYLQAAREANLRQAMETNSIVEPPGTRWAGTYSMTEVCVPISHGGSVIAVVTCESNLASPRPTVGMGAWTQNASRILLEMCARGEYPYTSTPTVLAHGVPRVMDGVILIDGDGTVQELTPNASSCLRRLGIRHSVIGRVLAEDITDVISNDALVEETLAVVVMGRAAWRVEISAHASTVNMRALPLTNGRHRLGAVILTRDVSEMRRREEELMTKDATIREIHHRVKNNLQTVSALLRL
ncbi:MAG: histidine kinase N-terminal domain-containing protein, partial [Actinomyces sp.]|nr:histidine kinase N-terminal domain-containing protein [Actinomyces sp.]